LSARVWVRLWQVLVMEGAGSFCCNRDRCRLFNLVLASLDNMSTLTFSDLGCVVCGLVRRWTGRLSGLDGSIVRV